MMGMADRNGDFKPFTKHEELATEDHTPSLKLDPHGFPLRPQPSDDPLGEMSRVLLRPLKKNSDGLQIHSIGADG